MSPKYQISYNFSAFYSLLRKLLVLYYFEVFVIKCLLSQQVVLKLVNQDMKIQLIKFKCNSTYVQNNFWKYLSDNEIFLHVKYTYTIIKFQYLEHCICQINSKSRRQYKLKLIPFIIAYRQRKQLLFILPVTTTAPLAII